MIVDAHAHLDFFAPGELPEVLAAIQNGPILTVANSVSLASWRATQELAGRCAYVIPSFGLHPLWGAGDRPSAAALEREVASAPMVGEIGLDYSRAKARQRGEQRRRFELLLHLAGKQHKVVTIHSKGAERDVLASLSRCPPVRAIIHWYQGPQDLVGEFVERGALFSVGFAVLDSPGVRDLVRRLPVSRLLLETDNPAARSVMGREPTPNLVWEVAQEVALLKGIDVLSLVRQVATNFRELVGEGGRGSPETQRDSDQELGERREAGPP